MYRAAVLVFALLFPSVAAAQQPCTTDAACASGLCSATRVCARPAVDRSAAVASKPIGCPTGHSDDAGLPADAAPTDAPGDGGGGRSGGLDGCSCAVGTEDVSGVGWLLLICLAIRRRARWAPAKR